MDTPLTTILQASIDEVQKGNVLIDPITGECIAPDDADALIDAFERTKRRADTLWAFKQLLATTLAALSTGDAKTRRVRGRARRAKITMPDTAWDQAKLREAWNAYPALREEALTIATLRVQIRSYKKILNESGPPDFETFKKMLLAADRGPCGTPAVSIET